MAAIREDMGYAAWPTMPHPQRSYQPGDPWGRRTTKAAGSSLGSTLVVQHFKVALPDSDEGGVESVGLEFRSTTTAHRKQTAQVGWSPSSLRPCGTSDLETWCDWISILVSTVSTRVLVNRQPGPPVLADYAKGILYHPCCSQLSSTPSITYCGMRLALAS